MKISRSTVTEKPCNPYWAYQSKWISETASLNVLGSTKNNYKVWNCRVIFPKKQVVTLNSFTARYWPAITGKVVLHRAFQSSAYRTKATPICFFCTMKWNGLPNFSNRQNAGWVQCCKTCTFKLWSEGRYSFAILPRNALCTSGMTHCQNKPLQETHWHTSRS